MIQILVTLVNKYLQTNSSEIRQLVITREQADELTAPINTIGIDEADVVFSQLIEDIQNATSQFDQRTQAVLGKVNVTERNISGLSGNSCASLTRN